MRADGNNLKRRESLNGKRKRKFGPEVGDADNEQKVTFFNRFNMWRLRFSVDGEIVLKAIVIVLMLVFFVLLQTTMFTRFRPFGSVPDLMLPFTVAVGVLEREKAGAVTGLISAFVIDAVGGATITLLPLLYMPAGYICGLLTTYRFRDSFPVMLTYTGISSILRSVITVIVALRTIFGITFVEAITDIAFPELIVNVIFAAIPHVLVRLVLRPFHKTRAERTGSE